MSLIALYYVCSVGIYYNVYRFKKHGATNDNKIINYLEILFSLNLIKFEAYRKPNKSNLYVSNWKSSYVDNEMVRNIARVKLKMMISL
jgi:hypothetical protein